MRTKPTNPLFYTKSYRKRRAIKKRKNAKSRIPGKRRYAMGVRFLVSLVVGYLGFKRD